MARRGEPGNHGGVWHSRMNPADPVKDLIVLTADKSMKLGVQALLGRAGQLAMRAVSYDVISHPENDPGVYGDGHNLLRPQCRRYRYAISICDRDGCGREALSREELEHRIGERLRGNGWEERSSSIVIDPELEAWIWGDWDVLAKKLPWDGDGGALRQWLTNRKLLLPEQAKPARPKEALQAAMRHARIPFTSAVHET